MQIGIYAERVVVGGGVWMLNQVKRDRLDVVAV